MPPAPTNAPVGRRRLLLASSAALLTGVEACARGIPDRQGTSPGPPASPQGQLAALERAHSARLGVYALDTATGTALTYRAGERFPMCSTYKVLAVAEFLHLAAGLTGRQLCQAAIEQSDNTAANLVVGALGGPRAVTAWARQLGDQLTRLDRTEPALNRAVPGDPRDTTTPAAIATDYAQILTKPARLTEDSQRLLTTWLTHAATGTARIRAAVPSAWTVAAKSGTGGHGTDNDIAVNWRPGNRQPVILAVMSTQAATPQDSLVTRAAEIAMRHVTGGSA